MSDIFPAVKDYLIERQEELEKKVKEMLTLCEDLQEHINENEKEIIRLNTELVDNAKHNMLGQLDELRSSIEAIEADDEEPLLLFRKNVAKALEEIQDTFRNNDINLVQDEVVKDTLYGGL